MTTTIGETCSLAALSDVDRNSFDQACLAQSFPGVAQDLRAKRAREDMAGRWQLARALQAHRDMRVLITWGDWDAVDRFTDTFLHEAATMLEFPRTDERSTMSQLAASIGQKVRRGFQQA